MIENPDKTKFLRITLTTTTFLVKSLTLRQTTPNTKMSIILQRPLQAIRTDRTTLTHLQRLCRTFTIRRKKQTDINTTTFRLFNPPARGENVLPLISRSKLSDRTIGINKHNAPNLQQKQNQKNDPQKPERNSEH